MVKWRVVVNHQIPRFISKRHRFVVMELFTIGMENNAAAVNIFYHIELNCYLFKQKRILKCPSYGNKQFIYINIVLSWNGKLYHHNLSLLQGSCMIQKKVYAVMIPFMIKRTEFAVALSYSRLTPILLCVVAGNYITAIKVRVNYSANDQK